MMRQLTGLIVVAVLVATGSAWGAHLTGIPDVLAYYPLDGNFQDMSDNQRDGEGTGTTVFNSDSGMFGGARESGLGSTTSMDSHTGGFRTFPDNPFNADGDMTVAMWLKWDGLSPLTVGGPLGRVGDVDLFGKRDTWGPAKGKANITGVGFTNDPRVSDGVHAWRPFDNLGRGACGKGQDPVADNCQAADADFKDQRFDSDGGGGVLPPSQEWVHWAFVYEGYTNQDDPATKEVNEADGTVSLYINAERIADMPNHYWNGSDLDIPYLSIGYGFDFKSQGGDGSTGYFPGWIDDVVIASTALDGAQILQISGIPEPATIALLGLGGLMLARRRR